MFTAEPAPVPLTWDRSSYQWKEKLLRKGLTSSTKATRCMLQWEGLEVIIYLVSGALKTKAEWLTWVLAQLETHLSTVGAITYLKLDRLLKMEAISFTSLWTVTLSVAHLPTRTWIEIVHKTTKHLQSMQPKPQFYRPEHLLIECQDRKLIWGTKYHPRWQGLPLEKWCHQLNAFIKEVVVWSRITWLLDRKETLLALNILITLTLLKVIKTNI